MPRSLLGDDPAGQRRPQNHGKHLYSLYTSIRAVVDHLKGVDPELAEVARQRYAYLTPWEADPAAMAEPLSLGRYRACEGEVTRMLVDLLRKQQDYDAKTPNTSGTQSGALGPQLTSRRCLCDRDVAARRAAVTRKQTAALPL